MRGLTRGLPCGLLALALLGGLAGPVGGQGAPASPAGRDAAPAAVAMGSITGRIEGAPEGTALAGTRVVLVQFRLDEQGVPQGEPIQAQPADAEGRYAFADVPIQARSVYQIGASVAGRTVSSRPFTFPPDQREVLLNLRVPHLVRDAGAVRIDEGLIAVEPRRGAVWVTEVLHLDNASPDVVEGVERPLLLGIPPQAEALELLRGIRATDTHERLGGTLLVYGNLPPGRTTVAFRYRLPVWLGEVALDKRYPHPVGTLSVLSPQGNLRLAGSHFAPQEAQEIEGTRYDAWGLLDLDAGEAVRVRLRGVPVRQEVYLIPLGGFFVVMASVLLWFLRRRLPVGGQATDTARAPSA
jgi:hypothetical protein